MRDDGLQAIPHSVGTRHPADITLENTDGSPPFIPPHFPMMVDEARHCGEIVAMVVATTLAAAKDGAELVAVDYEPLPAVTHSVTAVQPGAPLARGDASSNISIDAEVGDPAAANAAFASAAHIVKFETWVQRIAGVPMEPRAATGIYEPETGRYTLYAGIGGAVRPKQELAKILGVAEDKVRVVMHEVGGNFGTRGSFNPEFALVTWTARKVGRPVKWTCERSESFFLRRARPRSRQHRGDGARQRGPLSRPADQHAREYGRLPVYLRPCCAHLPLRHAARRRLQNPGDLLQR
jgi:carbon-monoxide dehydrogenase large subunit